MPARVRAIDLERVAKDATAFHVNGIDVMTAALALWNETDAATKRARLSKLPGAVAQYALRRN